MVNKKTKENKDHSELNELKKKQFYDFIPTEIAEMLMKLESFKGIKWLYVVEEEKFYKYETERGYWMKKDADYLRVTIRRFLNNKRKKWEKRGKINEVYDAFKALCINKKNFKLMDFSKNQFPEYINLKNGMLNFDKEELIQHHSDYYSQVQFPVEYDSNANFDTWEKTMRAWIPDSNTRKFLQEYIGYCLIPDNSAQLAVILVGNGSNGKSTFLETISALFGAENLSSIPLQKLSNKFEIAYVKDKLVNICSDIDPTYMKQTGYIKTLIHGEMLRGEYKNGKSFDFMPVTRLIFSANELPRVRDKSEGWYRSFEFVNFPNHFTKSDENYDPYLKNKLIKELPGILNWALEGLFRYKRKGGFTESESLKREKRKYKSSNDTIESFLENNTTKNENEFVQGEYLYKQYEDYCKNESLKPQSRQTFSVVLNNKGIISKPTYNKRAGKTVRCFHGLTYQN
ncbi:MAG: DNA primase family protein [Bacillota bacterium]